MPRYLIEYKIATSDGPWRCLREAEPTFPAAKEYVEELSRKNPTSVYRVTPIMEVEAPSIWHYPPPEEWADRYLVMYKGGLVGLYHTNESATNKAAAIMHGTVTRLQIEINSGKIRLPV